MGENHRTDPDFRWQADDAHLLAEILRVALSQDQLRVLSFAVYASYERLSPQEAALIRPVLGALAEAIDEQGHADTNDRELRRGVLHDVLDSRPGRWHHPGGRRKGVAIPLTLLRSMLEGDLTDDERDEIAGMAWREEDPGRPRPRRRRTKGGRLSPRPLPDQDPG